ncbi:MAG: hypothetical protein ACE5GC_10760 [Acidimicrobiia bacterium]
MFGFHQQWVWVAVFSTGLAGLWGITLAVRKTEPGRGFRVARLAAIAVILVQIGAGLVLWGQGRRPGDGFHVFYGIVIVFTLTFAYMYRIQLERRPALGYGLLLLFVMGLGIRAWVNVG